MSDRDVRMVRRKTVGQVRPTEYCSDPCQVPVLLLPLDSGGFVLLNGEGSVECFIDKRTTSASSVHFH